MLASYGKSLPLNRILTRRAHSLAKDVLYVDRGVVVVNKPSGLICQFSRSNGAPSEGGSSTVTEQSSSHQMSEDLRLLVDDIRQKFQLTSDLHPVHRLDKATTGALAFALTPAHARDFGQQFRSRTVEKTYLALVRGGSTSFTGRTGEIRSGLEFMDGRVSMYDSGVRKAISSERKLAETDWEVIATSPTVPLTLMKLRPHTGLKHQLRVHMAHALKAPVLGDTLYSQSKLPSSITDVIDVPKSQMYLHAAQLSFFRYSPVGRRKRLRVMVGAPLPRSFVRLCARIGIPLHIDFVKGGLWIDGENVGRHQAAIQQEDSEETMHQQDDIRWRLEHIGGRWVGG